jgi:heptosyltransferase-3
MLAPLQGKRYVVLHLYPKFNYKMWSDSGWLELARWIAAQGLHMVLTGGNDAARIAYAIASRNRWMPRSTCGVN